MALIGLVLGAAAYYGFQSLAPSWREMETARRKSQNFASALSKIDRFSDLMTQGYVSSKYDKVCFWDTYGAGKISSPDVAAKLKKLVADGWYALDDYIWPIVLFNGSDMELFYMKNYGDPVGLELAGTQCFRIASITVEITPPTLNSPGILEIRPLYPSGLR